VEKVHPVIHGDRWNMINGVYNTLGISYNMCWHILTEDINRRHIAAEFVPSVLNNNQKEN